MSLDWVHMVFVISEFGSVGLPKQTQPSDFQCSYSMFGACGVPLVEGIFKRVAFLSLTSTMCHLIGTRRKTWLYFTVLSN